MKTFYFILISLALLGCTSQEMMRVRQMEIQDMPLSELADGVYIGSFVYSGFEYRVKTTVSSHKIMAVEILQNRKSRHAKRAAAVVTDIVKHQTPRVDAISGATTTSKALMKAVENSLRSNAEH